MVAVRSFVLGRTAPIKFLAAGIVGVAALIAFTPLGSIVSGRLSESDANAREGIYHEAWQGALDSPILGWGGPRPSINPFSPPVGTHGQIWTAMFSHGLIGLALYIAFIGWALYSVTRRRDPVSVMLASVVWVAALQMFFYSMLPASLPIVLVAIGLVFRNDDDGPRNEVDVVARSGTLPAGVSR
jgi:O-antigen ligase